MFGICPASDVDGANLTVKREVGDIHPACHPVFSTYAPNHKATRVHAQPAALCQRRVEDLVCTESE